MMVHVENAFWAAVVYFPGLEVNRYFKKELYMHDFPYTVSPSLSWYAVLVHAQTLTSTEALYYDPNQAHFFVVNVAKLLLNIETE